MSPREPRFSTSSRRMISIEMFPLHQPREGQKRDVARLLYGVSKAALVRRANTGNAARHNLAPLRDEGRQQFNVLVVDVIDFFDAEFANLLAPEILLAANGGRLVSARGALRSRNGPSTLLLFCHGEVSLFFRGATSRGSGCRGRRGRSSRSRRLTRGRMRGRGGHSRQPGRSVGGAISATQHLLSQRWLRSLRLRTAMCALLAFLLPLIDSLQCFIDANRDELDDRILHAQAAFDFLYAGRVRRELHQDVIAFLMLFHTIRQTAFAPFFDFVDRAAVRRHVFRHLFDEGINLFFCCIGFDDEQILVDPHFSSFVVPGARLCSSAAFVARRLKLVMDLLTPSAIMDSVASAAVPMNSSRVSVCRLDIGDSK